LVTVVTSQAADQAPAAGEAGAEQDRTVAFHWACLGLPPRRAPPPVVVPAPEPPGSRRAARSPATRRCHPSTPPGSCWANAAARWPAVALKPDVVSSEPGACQPGSTFESAVHRPRARSAHRRSWTSLDEPRPMTMSALAQLANSTGVVRSCWPVRFDLHGRGCSRAVRRSGSRRVHSRLDPEL